MIKQVWFKNALALLSSIGLLFSFTSAPTHAQTPTPGSLQFDGRAAFVRTSDLPSLSAFTIEAWVKRTVDSGTYETLLSDANSNYSQAMLTVFVDGGGIDCGADQFAFYQFSGNVTQCSGVVADLNTWHHLAVTRDAAGTRRFFVDGVLRSTQTNTVAPVDSNGALSFGRAGDSATEYFAGLIDEVRVSSAALYTANFAPSTAPLSATAQTVGLWSLDEGSGQVVADRSGNGRHGTLGTSSGAETTDPTWVVDSPLSGVGPTAVPTASAQPSSTPPPTPTTAPTQIIAPSATPAPTQPAPASTFGTSLRFYGHGVTATDLDRVKIQIDDPANTKAGPPADIGATDFTLEFWMKAGAANNTAAEVACGSNVAWINGNIVIDRDRYSQDRKFGLSLAGGRVVFGISGEGTGDLTVCSSTNVLDGQWHHIAVQRRRSDGWLWMHIDGVLNAQADGPNGDVSYPDAGVPDNYCGGPCTGSDPYLVLGAEKHDAGAAYPSYNGWLDELRLSTALRYSGNFTRPQSPFVTDSSTAALYHFNEAASGACAGVVLDSSGAAGGPSNGMGRYGGSGTAGPQYSADVPATSGGSATATPLPTTTPAPTQTATASPSGTPSPAADVIFADDFESGTFTAWSSAVTDGADLSVSNSATFNGGYGVQGVIDDNNAIYLADNSPNAETRYRARFYFDPNSIAMASGNTHTLFRGDAASGATALRLEFRYSGGVYQVSAGARTDANLWVNTTWVTLSDAAHVFELDWRAATAGGNNGGVTLWVDNLQRGDLANLDNDTRRVDRVLWGAVSGIDSGTRGAYYFDHFESRRTTYIGP